MFLLLQIIVCWILLFTIISSAILATTPTILTPLGQIKGKWERSYENKTFLAFYGIPYAQPPIGKLRFEEPQPVQPWNKTWYANLTKICMQTRLPRGEIIGEEDCLYLNIYVPIEKIEQTKNKLPVLIDIHGGGFMQSHSQSVSGPQYLIDRDIILVTPNYRLGLFGFLSTLDENLPGNLGLKDQVAAIKFVKKYISYFGGDSNQITLSGTSAGGASVHFHFMSPLTRGLFKNGISFSGTALLPWTLQENAREKAFKIGETIGCDIKSSKTLVDCLKNSSAQLLTQQTDLFFNFFHIPISPFAPVVEPNAKNAFLTKHPYLLLQNGEVHDVPWITTVVKDEGEFLDGLLINYLNESYFQNHWMEYCPALFDFEYTVPLNKQQGVCNAIYSYCWKDGVPNFRSEKFIKMISDRLFILDAEKAAKLQANVNKSPVYFYKYGYEPKIGSALKFITNNKRMGVCHGDDTLLIMHNSKIKPLQKLSNDDENIKNILLDFIVSFMLNGQPTSGNIIWEPITKSNTTINYLNITKPTLIKMEVMQINNDNFWNTIKFEENEFISNT